MNWKKVFKNVKFLWVTTGVLIFLYALILTLDPGNKAQEVLLGFMYAISFPAWYLPAYLFPGSSDPSQFIFGEFVFLFLEWLVFFAFGYFQWFVVVPFLFQSLYRVFSKKKSTNFKEL